MPRKNLDRFSRIKPTITHASPKNRVSMVCESTLEHDRLYELEFDRGVQRFQTQPQTYGYRIHGKRRRYTPDLLIKLADGRFVYEEVKSQAEAESGRIRKKFAYLQMLFDECLGVPLRLYVGSSAANRARRTNLRRLFGFLQYSPDMAWLQELSSLSSSFTFATALKWAVRRGQSAAVIYTLLAHRQLVFDLDQPLSDATMLVVDHE